MQEILTIKNFGSIVNANITLKKTMLFIGSQASGKSTITKVIAIFRDIKFILESENSTPNYLNHFKQYGINSYFSEDTKFHYECDKYSISYGSLQWEIRLNDEFKSEIKREDERIRDLIRVVVKNNAVKQKVSPTAKNNEEESYFNMIYQSNRNNLFSLLKKQIYIPAERTLVSMVDDSSFFYKDVPLAECFLDFGKKFQNARNQIRNYKIDFLGIEYKFEDNKNKVYHNSTDSVLLTESASGFQAIIPMMLVIEANKNTQNSYIVEEPELNLFPKTQYDIIKFLIKNCNAESNIMITSHSPYMLSVLNNLLFANKVGTSSNLINQNIDSLIPKESWIDHQDFQAYYASEGEFVSISSPKTGLISSNELDDISNLIGNEFNLIMEQYKLIKRQDEKQDS